MKHYKYLGLLIYVALVMDIVANTTGGKILHLSFLTLSAGSLSIPFTYVIGDAITEVYGYKQARRASWIIVSSALFVALLFQVAVYLPPAPGFANNEAYKAVLGSAPRVAIAASVAVFTGQFINDYVLAKMKLLTRGKYLWSRTIGSTVAGQAVDSTLFYIIALYSVIPNGLLAKSILSAWFAKVLIEVAITPITYYVIKKLKSSEGIDYYDKDTDFTPFAFN